MFCQIKAEIYKITLNNICRYSIAICTLFTVIWGLAANGVAPNIFVNQAIPFIEILYVSSCLIVGSIWSAEYSDNTMGYLLIAGKSRVQVYLSKFICTYLFISFVHLLYGVILTFLNSTIHGFTYSQIYHLIVLLLLQWLLLLALSSIFTLTAIVVKKFSYLTMVMIVLYVLFRWLLSMLIRNTLPEVFGKLSYITLQYRVISSITNTDYNLISDCVSFCVIFIGFCFIAGLVIFGKQEH